MLLLDQRRNYLSLEEYWEVIVGLGDDVTLYSLGKYGIGNNSIISLNDVIYVLGIRLQ